MIGVSETVEDVPPAGEGVRSARVKVRCRTIEEDDLASVVRLLQVGFPDRSEPYWRTGLDRHRTQPLPDDVPRYGYVLERDGAIVGVLLALYRMVTDEAGTHLRCNLSSWYVLPEFRALGTLLDGFAMRDRRVTYTNVSPAPQTWQIHKARGFKPVCSGQMLVMPLLADLGRGRRVRVATPETLRLLPEPEARLVADHLAYGCIGLVCSDGEKAWAVLFQRRAIKLRPGKPGGRACPAFSSSTARPRSTCPPSSARSAGISCCTTPCRGSCSMPWASCRALPDTSSRAAPRNTPAARTCRPPETSPIPRSSCSVPKGAFRRSGTVPDRETHRNRDRRGFPPMSSRASTRRSAESSSF